MTSGSWSKFDDEVDLMISDHELPGRETIWHPPGEDTPSYDVNLTLRQTLFKLFLIPVWWRPDCTQSSEPVLSCCRSETDSSWLRRQRTLSSFIHPSGWLSMEADIVMVIHLSDDVTNECGLHITSDEMPAEGNLSHFHEELGLRFRKTDQVQSVLKCQRALSFDPPTKIYLIISLHQADYCENGAWWRGNYPLNYPHKDWLHCPYQLIWVQRWRNVTEYPDIFWRLIRLLHHLPPGRGAR